MSEYYQDTHRYDDMLDLPHHQSVRHPHMSLHDRAAQFAPFAALSGHEEAMEETARLTDERMELDETAIEKINEKLAYFAEHLSAQRQVAVTYFKPDTFKKGGAYLTDIGSIRKLDLNEHMVVMDSGMRIPMEEIVTVEEC